MNMGKINQFKPDVIHHPGITLEEKLQEIGMGPKEFAVRTGKPEKTITAVIKGKSSITAEMAVLFEQVTQIPAHFWMNYQRGYDEFIAREKHKSVVAGSVAWANRFPLKEMIAKKWLPAANSKEEITNNLLSFFGFASYKAWEDYYFNQLLKISFRISLSKVHEPYALSAWLRKGELQAANLRAHTYSARAFREKLAEIQKLSKEETGSDFSKIGSICLDAGVKTVLTPLLSDVHVSGSVRWINDVPLIQVAFSENNHHSALFTFFHEAGHILLHGKKEIFLESIDYSEKDIRKEKEADDFAAVWIKQARTS